jgi:predicted membrane channel-forming protein YqfA (hemolysin III family)
VSNGVHARDAKCSTEDCLLHMRSRPLLSSSSSSSVASTSNGLSLCFGDTSVATPPPCAGDATGFRLDFATLLSNSVVGNAASGLEVVGRLAPAPVANAAKALRAHIVVDEDECVFIDQYEIGERDPNDPTRPLKKGCSRFLEVVYGVLCTNPRPAVVNGKSTKWSELLGPSGHYERFSAWSHIFGTLVFLAYAIVRLAIPKNNDEVEQILATVAAFGTTFVFLSSSIYHATAPDAKLAFYTRFLDFFAIYLGIVLTATADIAAATQGFRNVPIVTIVDLPIAGTIVVVFFLWRRHRVSQEDTWVGVHAKEGGCVFSDGLFSRGHYDLHHSQLRETTSLLLTSSYFMSVPAAVMTLDSTTSMVVLTLQVVSFTVIVSGMVLDRVLKWPNKQLASGKFSCLACPSPNGPGCVVNSHGIWHVVAIVATAITFVAREYALDSYRKE